MDSQRRGKNRINQKSSSKKKEMRIASHYYQYSITLPITLHRQTNPLRTKNPFNTCKAHKPVGKHE